MFRGEHVGAKTIRKSKEYTLTIISIMVTIRVRLTKGIKRISKLLAAFSSLMWVMVTIWVFHDVDV